MMNIIAGKYKGIVLKAPEGQTVRPTLSRIKEALFNILSHQLTGSFLELYAGSGSIALEAASRGCDPVMMVEQDPGAIRCIKSNMKKIKNIPATVELIESDAYAYCQKKIGREKFDYIFLDPPYEQRNFDVWQQSAHLGLLLEKTGILMVQHSRKIVMPQIWSGARQYQQRHYGATVLSFYQSLERCYA